MTLRVVLANTAREAHDYCRDRDINPRSVLVVTLDPHSGYRLRGMSLEDDEVANIVRINGDLTLRQLRNYDRIVDEVYRAKNRGPRPPKNHAAEEPDV